MAGLITRTAVVSTQAACSTRSLVKIVDPGDNSDDLLGVSELIQLMGWEIGMEFNVEVACCTGLEPTKPKRYSLLAYWDECHVEDEVEDDDVPAIVY